VHGLDATGKKLFKSHDSGTLSEYVTALAWSPDGKTVAASSAAGEVMLWRDLSGRGEDAWSLLPVQKSDGQDADSSLPLLLSVDCLAFSSDGQLLAAGGQDGQVKIWQMHEVGADRGQPLQTLNNAPAWVDQLAWSPTGNQLAFNIGRYVQVWDANRGEVVATLNFEASSVLGMSWRPNGQHLAIAGDRGAKVWNAQDWDEEPDVLDMPAASVAIAWSPDSKYLASSNLDFTITVWHWENPHPWVMHGFPGKIRNLAWSERLTTVGAPLLAVSSVEGIVVWEKLAADSGGWEARVLDIHAEMVQAIAFQPGTLLLASASSDGWVCLWQKAKQMAQILEGAPQGFSALAWQPQGQKLAAGGKNGELLIWSKSTRAKGFRLIH
jgi:WD40 repeat protein